MNKVFLFICICMLLGCSNSNNKDFAPASEHIAKEKAPAILSVENAYKILIQEKIQDHIDTQKLQDQYPNFKQSIDSTLVLQTTHQEAIEDIILLDPISLENGNSKNIRTVITYTNTKQDTILANITRTKVVLDGEEIISSKVVLKAYNE